MLMGTIRMSLEGMYSLCVATLSEAGVQGDVAEAVSRHIVDAEVTGHPSHGLLQLPALVRDIRIGLIDPNATPVIQSKGAQLEVDARKAMAHWVLPKVVETAVVTAQRDGVCLALIQNIRSSGRLGAYVEKAARAGMAALFTTGSLGDQQEALVAAFGGHDRILGTNPIAFAAPTSSAPLIIDLSTAATTMGEIRRRRVLGDDLDAPAVVDELGAISRTTSAFYKGGAIVPAAKHKGYALALMVAALGALSGHRGTRGVNGSFLLVARPQSADYPNDLGTALEQVRHSRTPQPTTVRIPGDRYDEARSRAQTAGFLVQTPVLHEITRTREGLRRGD